MKCIVCGADTKLLKKLGDISAAFCWDHYPLSGFADAIPSDGGVEHESTLLWRRIQGEGDNGEEYSFLRSMRP